MLLQTKKHTGCAAPLTQCCTTLDDVYVAAQRMLIAHSGADASGYRRAACPPRVLHVRMVEDGPGLRQLVQAWRDHERLAVRFVQLRPQVVDDEVGYSHESGKLAVAGISAASAVPAASLFP